jgi:Cellulase (glycosyl hydrolase family 5)
MVKSTDISLDGAQEDHEPPWQSPNTIGVNFGAVQAAYYQNDQNGLNINPPCHYVEDSMKILRQAGIRTIRVPFYWESYERSRQEFYSDLFRILEHASINNLQVVLDNHHWETGSWLGWGLGFPNSVLSVRYPKRFGQPNYDHVRDFWFQFWDRTARDIQGRDVWERQVEFLKEVVTLTRDHPAVVAYEILNEPEIWRKEDYFKINRYNAFMLSQLRPLVRSRHKFVISWALPRGCVIDIARRQRNQITGLPDLRDLIYDGHAYPPNCFRLHYFHRIVAPLGAQLWMGEFNSGLRKGATLNKKQLFQYIKRFKNAGIYGWQLWKFDYRFDSNVEAFNLAQIDKINNRIKPTESFYHLAEAISTIKP